MAITKGRCTNAAGSAIAVLDVALLANTNWSIYDASAGTNAKTYCCSGVVTFYVWVSDNQADYFNVRIFQTWDSGTHVGSGWNTESLSFAKHQPVYTVHVSDLRFIWITTSIGGYVTNWVAYCGEIKRLIETNPYCLVVGANSYPTNYSPLHNEGYYVSWKLGRSDAGTANCGAAPVGQRAASPYRVWEDYNKDRRFFGETRVYYLDSAYYYIGSLDGVIIMFACPVEYTNGNTIVINGIEYIVYKDETNSIDSARTLLVRND